MPQANTHAHTHTLLGVTPRVFLQKSLTFAQDCGKKSITLPGLADSEVFREIGKEREKESERK